MSWCWQLCLIGRPPLLVKNMFLVAILPIGDCCGWNMSASVVARYTLVVHFHHGWLQVKHSLSPWAAPGQTFTFTKSGSRTNIHFHHGRLQVKHSLSPWAAPGQTFTFTKSGSRSNNKNFVFHSIITPVCTVGGRHINLTTANAGTWNPKNLGVLEIHFIFTVWQKNWLNSTVMLFFKCDQT